MAGFEKILEFGFEEVTRHKGTIRLEEMFRSGEMTHPRGGVRLEEMT